MKILSLAAAAVFAFGLTAAQAQERAADALTAEQFVVAAGASNLYEIEAARIAEQRGRNAAVKTFAQQMIADHTAAGEEMKQVVAKVGLEAPTALDEAHNQKIAELREEEGEDFDETYVDQQLEAHQNAVALFSRYAETGDQADLKAFAAKTLPTLQAHLQHVQELDNADLSQ
ncbi:DUF4142 domain-containing protein [Prosthecomicrobium pneumaticum]|uniref:Putative membrane protein n=1 Tax=Prosthecomicrobium pneumaticum TaxID=81895 RepID=A0A7W9FJG1_9HYPH|nr:DUF4142 domain-containing protein [Prosthecomicrobium pneumaticum]MBB5751541.1 putative membrane protein [Prosthecomicrobium pneumaticum]